MGLRRYPYYERVRPRTRVRLRKSGYGRPAPQLSWIQERSHLPWPVWTIEPDRVGLSHSESIIVIVQNVYNVAGRDRISGLSNNTWPCNYTEDFVWDWPYHPKFVTHICRHGIHSFILMLDIHGINMEFSERKCMLLFVTGAIFLHILALCYRNWMEGYHGDVMAMTLRPWRLCHLHNLPRTKRNLKSTMGCSGFRIGTTLDLVSRIFRDTWTVRSWPV